MLPIGNSSDTSKLSKGTAVNDVTADWNYPTRILFGYGRINDLPHCCHALGIKTPLLVTDPGLAELPLVAEVVQHCRDEGLKVAVFSDIKGNPTGSQIDAGSKAFRQGGHDGVIAFGGGSALDAGKAIGLIARQTVPLFDLAEPDGRLECVDERAIAPVVAVPTTAGTGSEVGRAAVITDELAGKKRVIFHPDIMPGRVILDPRLCAGLPAALTAATGMDALSHNLEALCAPGFHPLAEGIAHEGIRLAFTYLPRAYDDGSDLEARAQMLVASCMGATAFQRGLGAMHALAHVLGALYDSHHGLLNAILMPYVLQVNRSQICDVLERSCRYQGWANPGFDTFFEQVMELRERVEIPHSLAGVIENDLRASEIGTLATVDMAAAGNPIELTAAQYSDLFCRAYAGNLTS